MHLGRQVEPARTLLSVGPGQQPLTVVGGDVEAMDRPLRMFSLDSASLRSRVRLTRGGFRLLRMSEKWSWSAATRRILHRGLAESLPGRTKQVVVILFKRSFSRLVIGRLKVSLDQRSGFNFERTTLWPTS